MGVSAAPALTADADDPRRLVEVSGRSATAIVFAALLSAAAPAGAALRTATPPRTVVHVVLREGSFTFSRGSAPRGVVVFAVINRGTTTHELLFPRLARHTPVLHRGASARLAIAFEQRGRFYYICPIGEHMENGEAGSFRIR